MHKGFSYKLIFAVLGFIVMLVLSFVRSDNEKDRYSFKADLHSPKEYVVDIGKCGTLKYYLQPNVMTVYFRIQEQDKNLSYRISSVEDMKMFVSQNYKKGIWTETKEGEKLKSDKRSIPLNLEISIPRDKVYRHDVAKTSIAIFSGNVEKGSIKLKVINSKYAK